MAGANDPGFDNALFWNRRYRHDPTLGSGVGSRGRNLAHKRRIVEAFLAETQPRSVLDVGCGDHEVLKDVEPLSGYRGIDISVVIVASNRMLYPRRSFSHVDFAELEDVGSFVSDVVLCTEVVIHQHRKRSYDRLIANIVAAAAQGGLVSGYVSDPRPAIASEIIAWHEPLTDSLIRAGATDVVIEERSLESECLGFVSFRR